MPEETPHEDRQPVDPSAVALALDGKGTLDPRAAAFLEKQGRLVDLQAEELEHELNLRHWSLRVRHISDILKLSFELAGALILTAIVIFISASVWSASRDQSLVIEAFSVPPDLATKGLTGDTVATRLLDRLAELQAQTVSGRAASTYANNWGDDIKVQIPDTGVSIGELNRYLRAWLGHQTRITGNVFRTPTGVVVAVRIGSDAGITVSGTDVDLDGLIQKAAEAVYRSTQPYRYARYLYNAKRSKEAEAAFLALIANGSQQDRTWAYDGLGDLYRSQGALEKARQAYQGALAVQPDFGVAFGDLAVVDTLLAHDESALDYRKKAVALNQGDVDPAIAERFRFYVQAHGEQQLAVQLGDFESELKDDRAIESRTELIQVGVAQESVREDEAEAFAGLHDAGAVRQVFAGLLPVDDPVVNFHRERSRANCDILLGQWPDLLANRAKIDAGLKSLGAAGTITAERYFWPDLAYAFAQSGDMASAHVLIGRTPADCILCLRRRGSIDVLQKNWGGAQYWFARAVHDAPSLPFAYADWGAMLMAKGDYEGAIPKFKSANEKSPHFADPLEMWGEALMLKNRSDLALEKFAEADKFAPNWGRLHLKWGEALIYVGKPDDAKKQFQIAQSLDLTTAEQSELARMKGLHG